MSKVCLPWRINSGHCGDCENAGRSCFKSRAVATLVDPAKKPALLANVETRRRDRMVWQASVPMQSRCKCGRLEQYVVPRAHAPRRSVDDPPATLAKRARVQSEVVTAVRCGYRNMLVKQSCIFMKWTHKHERSLLLLKI